MFVRVKLGCLAGSPIHEPVEQADYNFTSSREIGYFLASQARKTDVCSVLFGMGDRSPVYDVDGSFQVILGTVEAGAANIKLSCTLTGGEELFPENYVQSGSTSESFLKYPTTDKEQETRGQIDLESTRKALSKFYSLSRFQFIYYEATIRQSGTDQQNICKIRVYFLPAWSAASDTSNPGSVSWMKSGSKLFRSISPESPVLEISTSQDLWKLDRKNSPPPAKKEEVKSGSVRRSLSRKAESDQTSSLSAEATLSLCSVIRALCPDNSDPSLENALLSSGIGTFHPLLLFVLKMGKVESPPVVKLKLSSRKVSQSGTSLRESKSSDYRRLVKEAKLKIQELRNTFYKEYSDEKFANDITKWNQQLKFRLSPRSQVQPNLQFIGKYSQLPAISRKPTQKSMTNRSGPAASPKTLMSPHAVREADKRPIFRIETKGYLAGLLNPRRGSPPASYTLAGDSLGKLNLHHVRLRARD